MRKYVIAGNWKMNNDLKASVHLISELVNNVKSLETSAEVIICPPFTSLETAQTLIKDSKIKLGAQNMSSELNGAFTGEISADMLLSVGCKYVILGHSERRTIFNESNELINKKLKTALVTGLIPIFCIGESLEERESNKTQKVIQTQIENGLKEIDNAGMEKIIIAYEPIWAIGTGKTATPNQAQEVHSFIRSLISKLYSNQIADNCIIQYGGSVKPDNASDLLSQTDIDGALVGGACLKADSFINIIKAVK